MGSFSYLLAFDYDVVVRALGKVQHGDGKEYLEKIIQVPFEIPAPNMENIHGSLFNKLNDILGDIPEENWDIGAWYQIFQYGLKAYIKSLRDVIRYTNVFYLKYELLKKETDPIDLLGLTCLQVFEPLIYSKLCFYKDTLCGESTAFLGARQKSEQEKLKKTMDTIFSDINMISNTVAAKNILAVLFPKTKDVFSDIVGISNYYDGSNYFIRNKISVSTCFERYFALALEADAIPTDMIRRLIYDAETDEVLSGMDLLYQNGKIKPELFDEINNYVNSDRIAEVSSERASLLLKCLAVKYGEFVVENQIFFEIPFEWRFQFCMNALLKRVDASSRF